MAPCVAQVRGHLGDVFACHLETYREACGHSLHPGPAAVESAAISADDHGEQLASRRRARARAWLNSLGYLNPAVSEDEAGSASGSE